MFASKGVLEHLARGILGIGALAVASLLIEHHHPVFALATLPVALFALRGCPMCWTIGLVQTLAAKIRGKDASAACVDGHCALDKRSAHL